MLPMFKGADAAEMRLLSAEISKTLKEKHDISLKVSKVLNLFATINGFNNWHVYNAHLEANPSIKSIASEYEFEFEELLHESASSSVKNENTMPYPSEGYLEYSKSELDNYLKMLMNKVSDRHFDFSKHSNSPEELFSYLSNISILDSSIKKSFRDKSSILNSICSALFGEIDITKTSITLSKIRKISNVDRLIEVSEQEWLDDECLAKLKRLLCRLPGYTEEDAIMGQLKSSVYEKANELLIDMDKLVDILDSNNRLPTVNVINRYHPENTNYMIGHKINVIQLPDLNIDEKEYIELEKMLINDNKGLFSTIEDDAMSYGGSVAIGLDEYGYKDKRCIVAQKNIVI